MSTVAAEFENVRWHDSKFIGISATRSAERFDGVEIDLMLLDQLPGAYRLAKLALSGCAVLRMTVDFDALEEVSCDIASGSCLQTSLWLQEVMSAVPPGVDSIPMYHFRLQMIAPGGSVECIASGFELRVGDLVAWP